MIEDDKGISAMYSRMLEMRGFQVHIAESGKEGLDMALKIKPEIIVCDMVMPDGDGFLVLEKRKTREELKNIPILVFTNLGSSSDKREAEKLGATEYLVKMETAPEKLAEKVNFHLKNAAKSR